MSVGKQTNLYRARVRVFPGGGGREFGYTFYALAADVPSVCAAAGAVVSEHGYGTRKVEVDEVSLVSENGFVVK